MLLSVHYVNYSQKQEYHNLLFGAVVNCGKLEMKLIPIKEFFSWYNIWLKWTI